MIAYELAELATKARGKPTYQRIQTGQSHSFQLVRPARYAAPMAMTVTVQVAIRAGQPNFSGGHKGRAGRPADQAMTAATAAQPTAVTAAKR
jgi:hypothetical protein